MLLGPPNGRVRAMVEKTQAIEARHGPFSLALIVGNVFADAEHLTEDETAFLHGSLTSTSKCERILTSVKCQCRHTSSLGHICQKMSSRI